MIEVQDQMQAIETEGFELYVILESFESFNVWGARLCEQCGELHLGVEVLGTAVSVGSNDKSFDPHSDLESMIPIIDAARTLAIREMARRN